MKNVKRRRSARLVASLAIIGVSICTWANTAQAGPTLLRKNPTNPRYFQNAAGKPVYLTGSHTFLEHHDHSSHPTFNYAAWINYLVAQNANHMRYWKFDRSYYQLGERPAGYITPQPWPRTGPGNSADGRLKFNLAQFDQSYFDRMRARIIQAGNAGIYVSIMLFNGIWQNDGEADSWNKHFFNPANTVNSFSMSRKDTYTLNNSTWVAYMEGYARKIVDTVNDLDNVLYEIGNEMSPASKQFQYHMIDYIHAYEQGKPKQHPVGMGAHDVTASDASINADLLASNADYVSLSVRTSPGPFGMNNAPGTKVSILDSDHTWGFPAPGNNSAWVWKSLCRGHNPIYLDTYDVTTAYTTDTNLRSALGYARTLANRIDLNHMIPNGAIASTGYALVETNAEFLVYQPGTAAFTVNLSARSFSYEWINPSNGNITHTGTITATNGNNSFTPPSSYSSSYGAILHLIAGSAPTPTPTPTPTVPPTPTPTPTTTPAPGSFGIGDRVKVNVAPSLRVRSSSALAGTVLGEQLYLARGTVTGGPVAADGYKWWNINYDKSPDGWSIEGTGWLVQVEAISAPTGLHITTP